MAKLSDSLTAPHRKFGDRAVGRPKGSVKELSEYVRYKTQGGRKAIEILYEIASKGKRDADRMRAVELLLDRGFGKSVDIQLLATVTGTEAGAQLVALNSAVLEALARVSVPRALPAGDVVDVTPLEFEPATDAVSVADADKPPES